MTTVLYQKWRDLAFFHWEMDPASVRRTLPGDLELDLFHGRCFVAIVPFAMRGVRPRFLPAVPGVSNLLELNLRTYVRDEHGRTGVWFHSLDANRSLAVAVARGLFSLPYHRADMHREVDPESSTTTFLSTRRGVAPPPLRYRYRPRGARRRAAPGSLEFFLLERYVLFAETAGGLRYGRVRHRPYAYSDLDPIEVDDRLFGLEGLPIPKRPVDHAVFSPGVDVAVGPTRRAQRPAP